MNKSSERSAAFVQTLFKRKGKLILILFGALVGTYGMFDLIIHGYKKNDKKRYIIVFLGALLFILGGFVICWNI